MELKERITIDDFQGTTFKVKIIELENEQNASFTHYLHNHKNGASQSYKQNALEHVKDVLKQKYPENIISNKTAEEALQYLLYDFKDLAPFPQPKEQKFKFIDLFAGIGGFRMALQNIGGKCVFTSEWDKYSKKTYQANFGEIPFGDITKPETKNYIPDGVEI